MIMYIYPSLSKCAEQYDVTIFGNISTRKLPKRVL